MGVNGLASVIQEYPRACRPVTIERLARDHRSNFGSRPVLVVDGNNFIATLYCSSQTNLECIYGGQWIQFMEVLKEFVSKCKNEGIKLVFIFDGTLCREKIPEWVNTRMYRYKTIADVFDKITHNPERAVSCKTLPPDLKMLGKYALKELDVEIYQADTELPADNYTAEYANNNDGVFAILSDDSDFIIFDTKPVLSISRMKLDRLETVLYDRKSLAECLSISTKQLPLFACLMGNDYVPFPIVKQFQRTLLRRGQLTKSIAARKICELIRRKVWTGDVSDEAEIASIAIEVFGFETESGRIKRGLESYVMNSSAHPLTPCRKMSLNFQNAAHERHLNCSYTCVYNLLCKRQHGSLEIFEDGSRLPSALAYRPIRQRCYGLLFDCYSDPDSTEATVVEERCWYKRSRSDTNNLKLPEKIGPLPLRNKSDKINIEEIWLNSSERQQLELFWHILEIPMDFKLLIKLPEDQFTLSCILNYLIGGLESGPLLEPLDVAVFVAQALWEPSPHIIKELEQPKVQASTVNLSTLFVCGIQAVVTALETCGFPTPHKYVKPWRFFDGKLFHHLHNTAKETPTVHILCDYKDEIIEKFYKLLPVITSNTAYDPDRFEWKHILNDFKLKPNSLG